MTSFCWSEFIKVSEAGQGSSKENYEEFCGKLFLRIQICEKGEVFVDSKICMKFDFNAKERIVLKPNILQIMPVV